MNKNSAKEALKNIGSLLSSEKFADITVVVDGNQIKAHKNILAARNEVFNAMLTNNTAESNKNVIEIPDVDIVTFKSFLKYLYTGTVENEDLTLELLIFADKYLDQNLKNICENYLCRDINFDNAIDKLLIANRHSCHDLNTRSATYIVNHVTKFMECSKFEEVLACKDVIKSILGELEALIPDSQRTFVFSFNVQSMYYDQQFNSNEVVFLMKDFQWGVRIGRVTSNNMEWLSCLLSAYGDQSIAVNFRVKLLSQKAGINGPCYNNKNFVFDSVNKRPVIPLIPYSVINQTDYKLAYWPNNIIKLEVSLKF